MRKTMKMQKPPYVEAGEHLVWTPTGEIYQPVRVHYHVSDLLRLERRFRKLKCMDTDPVRQRWVWLYCGEATRIQLANPPRKNRAHPSVLGSFLRKAPPEIVLDVRSFERAIRAILFFQKRLPHSLLRVAEVSVVNKVFHRSEDTSAITFDHLFERMHPVFYDDSRSQL